MFFKTLKYDLKNYFLISYKKYLIPLFLFPSIILIFDMLLKNSRVLNSSNATVTDLGMYFFRGMGEYEVGNGNIFQFPSVWMLFNLLLFYFVLYYPFNDLMGYGRQVLLLTRSRGAWWLSKCVTTTVGVLVYFMIAYIEITLYSLIAKIKFSAFVSAEAVSEIVELGTQDSNFSQLFMQEPMFIAVFVLPLLVAVALALLQMLVSLLCKPFYSYILTITILLVSAYYLSPFVIGNYAMTIRSDLVLSNGVNQNAGLIITFATIIASVIAGYFVFQRYDILNKE